MKYKITNFKSKIILSVLFLILNSSFLISQDTWVQTYQPFYNPAGDNDYYVEDIRVCPDGGFAVTGDYSYFDDWEQYKWGYLMKTDSDGNFLWAKKDTVSFYSETESTAFVVLDNGSYICVGKNAWIGGGHYIIKRDSNGDRHWVLQSDPDYSIEAMELTDNGNLITTGSSMDDTINLQKFDPEGNLIWRETYLPDGFEYGGGRSVIQTSDGGYAITGSIHSENTDIIILKTDANGDSLWTWTYDGYGLIDRGNCITNTYDGDILIGGYLNYNPPIYHYGFLGKFDLLGNNLFIHQFETWHIRSCLQDNDNNYVIYSGHAMLKTNDFGDTLWYNVLPYSSLNCEPGNEKSIQSIDTGYICVSIDRISGQDYIVLYKTNESGIVPVSDNIIFFENNWNLRNYPNPFNP
ncbi:MAG: hypothetical protein KAT74_04900, partial [Candidatus Cloacimonetes bacterium]|nr:hypothetical protein [Candidatus Cloacimonadota bacterium]